MVIKNLEDRKKVKIAIVISDAVRGNFKDNEN